MASINEDYYKTLAYNKNMQQVLLDIANFEDKEKEQLLNTAIKYNRPKLALMLIDNKVKIEVNKNEALHKLVGKSNCVALLEGLNQRGHDLNRGLGLMVKIIFEKNIKMQNVEYLCGIIEQKDSSTVTRLLSSLCADMMQKDTSEEKKENQLNILHMFLKKISKEKLNEIIDPLQAKSYIARDFAEKIKIWNMAYVLDEELPVNEEVKSKKIKI